MLHEYTAWEYACAQDAAGTLRCQVNGVLGRFPNQWSCKNACRLGESRCAVDETLPSNDPVVGACLTCMASCSQYETIACTVEVQGGCLYDGQLVVDGETVVCLCQ
jgi:hypothetical protein